MARSPNEIWTAKKAMVLGNNFDSDLGSEVRFVTAVIADGSVKFLPVVKISPSHSFFVFLSPKLLKFDEIRGVKFLA